MYCRKCGNQLPEEASVCPSCGCLVNEIVPAPVAEPNAEPVAPAPNQPSKAQKVFYKLSHIFTKVGLIMNAVIFGFVVLSLLLYAVGVPEGGVAFSYIGFIFSSICVELATVGFVFSLIQKVEPDQRRTSIPVFAVSLVLAVVSYVAFYVGGIAVGMEYSEYFAELIESFYYY